MPKSYLQPTPECVPTERFDQPLSEAEQHHVRTCARCEAELSLWQEYRDSKPGADEGAAVQWIVSELRRRSAAERTATTRPVRASWLAGFRSGPLVGFAAIVLALGAGYLLWDPEPQVAVPSGDQRYRTTTVTVTSPRGDLTVPPASLIWVAVDGAVEYNVTLLEVDRSLVWRTTSRSAQVALPPDIIERIVPGRTLLWAVTALDEAGRSIGESGMQSFRVGVTPGSRRN